MKKGHILLIMLILLGALITGCGAATPPAPQTLPMGDYVYGQILLNEVKVINWDDNLECYQNNTKVNCDSVNPNNWTTFKKVDSSRSASIELIYESPDDKPAEYLLVKVGDGKCPPQAAGLYTACDFVQSTIKYLK